MRWSAPGAGRHRVSGPGVADGARDQCFETAYKPLPNIASVRLLSAVSRPHQSLVLTDGLETAAAFSFSIAIRTTKRSSLVQRRPGLPLRFGGFGAGRRFRRET